MKVLMINGSPDIHGCVHTAMEIAAEIFRKNNVETIRNMARNMVFLMKSIQNGIKRLTECRKQSTNTLPISYARKSIIDNGDAKADAGRGIHACRHLLFTCIFRTQSFLNQRGMKSSFATLV